MFPHPMAGQLSGSALSPDRAAFIALLVKGRLERQSNRVRGRSWYHRGSDVALASTRCDLSNDTSDPIYHQSGHFSRCPACTRRNDQMRRAMP